MKLLLLAFFLISFLAQTTQGGWVEKKCWDNQGVCRSHCRSNEINHSTCANKNKCCLTRDKIPKETTGEPGEQATTRSAPPSAGALTPPPGGATGAAPAGSDAAGATPAPPTPSAGGATTAPATPAPEAAATPAPEAAATPAPEAAATDAAEAAQTEAAAEDDGE